MKCDEITRSNGIDNRLNVFRARVTSLFMRYQLIVDDIIMLYNIWLGHDDKTVVSL
jgi:hypothetical protein